MIMCMCDPSIHRSIVAVTNRRLCARPFLEQVKRICIFRPASLVLREKDLDENAYASLAAEVLAICNSYQIPCILHSFPDVAKALGVKQIHLPLWRLEDMAASRPQSLAFFSAIGASVHSVDEAQRAQALGATYLTAGHIFTTDCKKGLPPRGLQFLQEVCQSVSIPVYAIGGITLDPQKIETVLSCGASRVCIMSGMMQL